MSLEINNNIHTLKLGFHQILISFKKFFLKIFFEIKLYILVVLLFMFYIVLRPLEEFLALFFIW